MLPKAPPVGCLYLTALIGKIDPLEGHQLLYELQSNQWGLVEISRCLVLSATVGEIASQILNIQASLTLLSPRVEPRQSHLQWED